jgi:hypothetical protein
LGLVLLSAAGVATARPIDRGAKPAPAESRKDAEGFLAEIKADGPYQAGQAASFTVGLTPKAGYHIDPQFPMKWKADDAPDGVSFAKSILKREDGTFTEKEGSFKVGFTAAKPGKYTLGGTLSLSVCNEKNCVMEKVPLDVQISVR